MSGHFSPAFFKANRDRLTKLFAGSAPIVLTASGEVQRNGPHAYKFRQDSSFWYFTGMDSADLVLVIDKGREYVILPEHYNRKVFFEGATDVSVLAKVSGIKEFLNYKEGWKRLSTRLKKVKYAATIAPMPNYIDHGGFYSNPSRAALVESIKSYNDTIKFLDLSQHVVKMRMVKQPPEFAALQQAIDITTSAIKKIRRRGWGAYSSEFDIETEIQRYFRQGGADEPTFIIVAAGSASCTIHHLPSKQKLPKVGPMLLDIGAEVDGYTSDITRTYLIGGAKKRFRSVYEAVHDVHQFALNKLKPGVVLRQYESEIELYMGEKLRELGLIRTVTTENVRKFYPTYTSHYLGLDAHDAGDYDFPLAKDMVLTIEPGIYIPKEGIGVRIEDDVVITSDSVRVMSDGLPIALT